MYSPFSVVFGREPRLFAQLDLGGQLVSINGYQQQAQRFMNRAHDIIQLENWNTQARNALLVVLYR